MFSVIELQVLTMGLTDIGLYVFLRKYMCGVHVLDKGCGRIHVQVYVGCRIFQVVKSYLCVSVPVLDDDCGAFICFVYVDSIMDDKLVSGLMFHCMLGLFRHFSCLLVCPCGLCLQFVRTSQPTNQTINQPTNQPINKPTNQPTN